MLIGFRILLILLVVVECPRSGLSDVVQRGESGDSVSENGVSSDGCSGWREYEDSLTGAVDDDQVRKVGATVARRSANPTKRDVTTYQPLNDEPQTANVGGRDAEADESSYTQPQMQSAGEKSPNARTPVGKREVSSRTSEPLETDSRLDGSRRENSEESMKLHDMSLYQPSYSLQPKETENTETFQQARHALRSSFKRSTEDQKFDPKMENVFEAEGPTESGIDTSEMRSTRSLTEFLFHGINNLPIPSDLDSEKIAAHQRSHSASIRNNRNPTRTVNEFAPADPAVNRDVVQSPRDAMHHRSVEPVSESLDMIRRQNDAQPGDAMPLFPANYYQKRRCEHPHTKHQKCNKCDDKCGDKGYKCNKCGGQHCDCQKREAALPTSNSFFRDVNGNLIPQEALKRNVRSVPKGTLHLEPGYTQANLNCSMLECDNSVVKRQANPQYSNKLLKTGKLVRRDASGKSFPMEMLKFELQYTQNKLKNKMKTGPYHVTKRDVELNPPYELLRRGNEEYSFKKRANTAVTRKVRSIPLEMLNFELDYKRQRLHEKKRQITPENQMINRDIKLYQPYYAMEPIESENGQSLNQEPEADTPYTQSSLDGTPLDNDNVLKRDTVNIGAVQTGLPRSAMDRSSRSYGQMESSADSETDDRDMTMQLPLHPLPSTGSEAEPIQQNAETIDQNAEQLEQNAEPIDQNDAEQLEQTAEPTDQNAEQLEQNAEPINQNDAAQMEQNDESVEQNAGADLSDDHPVFQSGFEESPVELNHVRKRNTSARFTARPVDRSFRSYGKKDSLDETEMVDRDIKMYQPFYALPIDGLENPGPSEQNTGGESSRFEQPTFKRSSNVNHRVRKRRAFRRSSRPRARIHPSTGRKESSEEAAMVDHDIKMYQPFYALPLAALDNVELSGKNEEDEISGVRTSPQESVDQSYVNSRVQKRGTLTKSFESPNESLLNLNGKRNLRRLTKSVLETKNKTF